MKRIQFDEQPFQLDAINAIADIFDGQYETSGKKLETLSKKIASEDSLLSGLHQDFTIRGNALQIDDGSIAEKVHEIQEKNGIDADQYGDFAQNARNFTIEMETGTGKTYVYVRTALELARRYGWRKYMIIVPNVPIKEGVINAIDTMRLHLESMYDDVGHFNASVYDSKNIGLISDFAQSEDVELLIVTIDSFNKQDNLMNNEHESLGWQKPVDVLASVAPIVIVDEPQSKMSTPRSKAALERLQPLFVLRYSATHRKGEYYNLMYQLDPVAAHQQNLVKTVYVRSAGISGTSAKPYIKLLQVRTKSSGSPEALIEFNKRIGSQIVAKSQWVKDATDLEEVTENDSYAGYILDGISAREGSEHISFEGSSDDLYLGESIGGFSDEVMKAQLRATISAHLEKEKSLRDVGIKVLSLFFVDKVASYWEQDATGDYVPGKIQIWFKEILTELLNSPRYNDLYAGIAIDQLYDAYFSILRKKKATNSQFIDSNESTSPEYKQAESEAYMRIMKDKEDLLDINTPLRFIFSHSALKEGWDNPNVFQICMMRDSNSPLDRRQTIGRGLRLPVNQDGARSFDPQINQLTVVASESYEEFAQHLQKEYIRDGIVFGRLRSNAFSKILDIDNNQEIGFSVSKAIWQELVENGFVLSNGELTAAFKPDVVGFSLKLSSEFSKYEAEVQAIMRDYQLRSIIKQDNPVEVSFNKALLTNPDFKSLWQKINKHATYRVSFDSEKLIERAAESIAEMPPINAVKVIQTEGKIRYVRGEIDGQDVGGSRTVSVLEVVRMPDIISFLQKETTLTRHTLAQILVRSNRLNDMLKNPNDFKLAVLEKIKVMQREVQIQNIVYRIEPLKPNLSEKKVASLLDKKVIRQLEQVYKVNRKDRSLSDFIPIDSKINERKFAEKLDNDPNILVFVKLPPEFKIPTPFGGYNPDWAYVYQDKDQQKQYLIRETKSTLDQESLQRSTEKAKVACARVFFKTLGIDYELATGDSPLYTT